MPGEVAALRRLLTLRIFQGKYIGNSGENAGCSGIELKGLGLQVSLEGQWEPSTESLCEVGCQNWGLWADL